MFHLIPADFFHHLSDYLSLLDIINLSRVSVDLDIFLSNDESFWQAKCSSGNKKSHEQTWKGFYVANYMNVLTFGDNKEGQLGKLSGVKFKDIAISRHTIAIDLHHNVWTFGANIGHNKGNSTIPHKLDVKAKYVATSNNHIGFIDMDNNVWVHGINDEGELGIEFGSFTCRYEYIKIPYFISHDLCEVKCKVQQICFGYSHTILLDTENNIWGSGTNNYGQLGLGDCYSRTRFTQILPSNGFKGKAKQIAVGSGHQSSHTVIIDLEDNVWGFGRSGFGQLGQEDNDYHPSPIQISLTSSEFNGKAKQVAAGYVHTVIIDLEDNVWTLGDNNYGQLGVGRDRHSSYIPQKVGIKAKQIVAGEFHTMLIDLEDNVWSFGLNHDGQLGVKGIDRSYIPIPNIKAVKIAAGNGSSSIITRI